jgi:hypothetical protein
MPLLIVRGINMIQLSMDQSKSTIILDIRVNIGVRNLQFSNNLFMSLTQCLK